MSEQEELVLEKLADAYNAFVKLPDLHASDLPEFTFAIHACMNIVLARAGLRETKVYRPFAVSDELRVEIRREAVRVFRDLMVTANIDE